jgi:outer membrane protein insertion porin family
MSNRRRSLPALLLCNFSILLFAGANALAAAASAQSSAQQPQPTVERSQPQPPQAEPPKPAPKKPNPFETVPTTAEPGAPAPAAPAPAIPAPVTPAPATQTAPPAAAPKPGTPQLEAPKAPAEGPVTPPQDIVEAIEFRGSRRVPQDTLRAMIYTKKGDKYDEDALHRDFMTLWNTGRFDDIALEREGGTSGWIIRFVVTERRVVRSIKYEGNKSITVSEILDRFKERHVGLTVEQQYEPSRVQHATNVLKEFLAERGHQFADVNPEIRQIPPSSIEVTFRINEGAKVKVGNIDIVNNVVFSQKEIVRSMKNLKPIGIPYSLYLENLFSKAYDSTKLEEDKDRIRNFYQIHGYFLAKTVDSKVTMRDVGGEGFKIPLIYPNKPGKRADISITVDEGRQYFLNKISFTGVKLFRTPEALMRPIFGMAEGDVFSTDKLQKGLKNLQKLYGEFGYIDVVPEPNFDPLPNSNKIDLSIAVDEGKQFFVRRIDFSGNTTTRDKVIRREILIDEGDMYNTKLWEISLLRLNQLGYFEQLKEEDAASITRDTKNNTVDITLKVKERGKNSVSLNGGVSGIAGTFIGLGYSTNNFLGMGETLSLDAQLGTRIQSATFGFQEPYLFDRPLQAGFTLFVQRFNYDQAREASILSGQNLIPLYQALGTQNLMNYVSKGYGGTLYMTYPLKRSFARIGLTYGLDEQTIIPGTTGSTSYFSYSNFLNFDGPNQLTGIVTSRVIPSYTYNTVDHPITPTHGRSLFASISVAGGPLGGNVNMVSPTISATYFRAGFKHGHVIGMRILGRFITGYGDRVAPPMNRIFMGGEQDVRGFQTWSIGPLAFVPSDTSVKVLNNDGTPRMQKQYVNGTIQLVNVTQNVPLYQITFPGGDTQGIYNIEYRIPIFGPVVLAPFFDVGVNRISLPSQLRLNPDRINSLNYNYPQVGFDNRAYIVPQSQMIRTSTGLELQIMMPVVNAPFRLYWAYNPTVVSGVYPPPVVADPSMFPNQASYINGFLTFGRPAPYNEKRTYFHFTISRTF